MSDFSAIQYTKLIPINSVGIHTSSTLFIDGDDVTETTTVFINGTSTKEFVIVSPTRLLVDIPQSQIGNAISTISVAGSSGTVGSLSFSLTSKTAMTDSRYVVQRFFNTLLSDPGSDVFSPSSGVGILSRIGVVDFEDVEVFITSAIKRAEEITIERQKPEIADSKTLTMVNIINVSYSINTLTASVSLQFVLGNGTTVNTDFNLAS